MTLEELRAKEEEIALVCRTNGVSRLDVFGSVARREAGETSDLDLLIELFPSEEKVYLRLDRIARALESIVPARTDLVLNERLTNPYVRRSVERERQNLYGS